MEFLAGRTADGNKNLRELLGKSDEKYVPPTFFAWISMARGDQEEAYRQIQKAIEMKDSWLNFNRIAPKPIRALNPKIEALLMETGWER